MGYRKERTHIDAPDPSPGRHGAAGAMDERKAGLCLA
jgi:hypothetical protein